MRVQDGTCTCSTHCLHSSTYPPGSTANASQRAVSPHVLQASAQTPLYIPAAAEKCCCSTGGLPDPIPDALVMSHVMSCHMTHVYCPASPGRLLILCTCSAVIAGMCSYTAGPGGSSSGGPRPPGSGPAPPGGSSGSGEWQPACNPGRECRHMSAAYIPVLSFQPVSLRSTDVYHPNDSNW
jgi:hypothetical protein